ncbi:hypothetical protein Ahy_B09g099259 [Arachis hypogaea]|uniref:Transposase MuDR plant domain-containing protein n=1 Tax=Arachis hypogaea TaxID=3818 RepID=A0A444XTG1_ARAHY|nr:hypothetical protein Ahy_B09g099259 [Arachis hypogaea]
MRNSDSGVIFECENPTLLRTWRANSLFELKSLILTHVGGEERKEVRRVGYRMLAPMGGGVFWFRLFWLNGDEHVRLIVDVHGRIVVEQVMKFSAEDDPPLTLRLLHCASPVVDMDVDGEEFDEEYITDSHESGSSEDDDEDEFNTFFLLQADDYNIDGGVEFKVSHRFRNREAVLQGVKNYNIRKSAEYRVLKLDQLKYYVCCRQFTDGCPWSLRVVFRQNLGYW